MTPPGRPSPLAVCALLAGAVLALASAGNHPLALAALPVVAGLLAAELDRSGGLLAVRVVRLASRALPPVVRDEHAAEWEDHVLAISEQGMRPLLAALWIAVRTALPLSLRLRVCLVRVTAAVTLARLIIAWGKATPLGKDEHARLPCASAFVRGILLTWAWLVIPVRAAMPRMSVLQAAALSLPLQLVLIFGPFGSTGLVLYTSATWFAAAFSVWCYWLFSEPDRVMRALDRVAGIALYGESSQES